MKSIRILRTAALLAAAALPAFAESVYVPLAVNTEAGGFRLQTEVTVTNPGAAAVRIDRFFIPTDADGTARPEGNRPTPLDVAARASVVLPPVSNATSGLLEISADDNVVVRARLTAGRHGSEMPVITAQNALAANATAHLQGMERSLDRVATFGVVNLGRGPARCTVRFFRATGEALGAATVLTVPPLSSNQITDPLAPAENVSSVRGTASCDQTFYAWVSTVDLQAADAQIQGPGEPASSALFRPGEEPRCGSGIDCFEQNGAIFTPSRNNPVRVINLPFAKGVDYKKARVEVDVRHGGWYGPQPDGIHQLLTLARGDAETRLGYVAARGPSRNFVFLIHNLGLPGEAGNRLSQDFALQPGRTYHLDYTYDPANSRVHLVITENGNKVVELTDTTTFVERIRSDGENFFVQFGIPASGPHSPSVGWTYSNLKVEFHR